MLFNYDSLENHFNNNLTFKLDYGFSLDELDNMISWQRPVYTKLIMDKRKNEQELADLQQRQELNIGR